MTPQRYEQIGEVYQAALALAPAQRAAFLTQACAGDKELRREVEQLLASHAKAGSFLANPALEAAAELIAAEQESALIGRRLSHYRIVAHIGAGGMGEVYLAEDEKLERKVALKLLPVEFTTHPERVRRFEREAKAASATDHPNIVTIHEIGEADGIHFIAEEFVGGETLRQRIKRAPLPLLEALEIAQQIAAALAAAHAASVVHRDIKPENVMVRPDGFVKVLDFGLAIVAQPRPLSHDSQTPTIPADTAPGTIMGTVAYMSPEQTRGQKADARSDLWSLGVVLYEMLAGYLPFPGASTPEVFVAILDRAPLPLNEQPPEVEQLLAKLLAKDREQRYPAASQLAAELKKLHHRLELDAERAAAPDSAAREPLPANKLRDAATLTDTAPTATHEQALDTRPTGHAAPPTKAARAAVVAALLVVTLLGVAVWRWWPQPAASPPAAVTLPERSFSYWLTVQKMRDGKPYQAEFQSSGRDFYESGWRFRFNFTSPQAGYLYLINEGPANGGISYWLLFPMPSVNKASARIESGQTMTTGWFTFNENTGDEKIWVIWIAEPISELENIKADVLTSQEQGEIRRPQQRDTVRRLLATLNQSKSEAQEDRVKLQTIVTGRGNHLVHSAELRHH